MSWLCSTQVLSESSTQSDTSSQNYGEIVGYLNIFDTDYKLLRGENKIGRDPDVCSIVLENKTLSKVHAVVESEGPDDTYLYDVGSTNKTRIGKMVLKPHARFKLNDNDLIIFGNVNAKFKIYRENHDQLQSLLSPVKNSKGDAGNETTVPGSPDINDSIFEASTQCKLVDETPSPHVFKTPQFLKPKRSQLKSKFIDDEDDIYSLQTQAPIVADERANLNYSDIYDQPTQVQFKTPERIKEKLSKFSYKEKTEELNSPDIFEKETQCNVNKVCDDSIFDQPTQLPVSKEIEKFSMDDDDDFIFGLATQVPNKEKKSVNESIFEEETQVSLKNKKISDKIFDAETRKVNLRESIFDAATQLPAKEKETVLNNSVFEEETQIPINSRFSKNESIFEAETQVPVKTKNKVPDSIFDAETEQPEKGFSSLNLDDSESSLFDAETQFPQKKDSSNDSNEIIASLPDSIFQETTQIPEKTAQSETKRKRPSKHNNKALFKGSKRRSADSAKDYLNDGEDDVLCEFMSQNFPVFNQAKKENENDVFEEDINLEEIPNHVFEPDTQTPGYDKQRLHLDSGIADEKDEDEDLTQSLSLNETVNDSGVKNKEDSVIAKAKGRINMVLSSSSDEDGDIADNQNKLNANHNFKVPNSRLFEDCVPTQILPSNNVENPQISSASQVRKELEDDIPTQVFNEKQNEDITPTQPFQPDKKTDDANEDLIPTQTFDNIRIVEPSDDETDSDIELPVNKKIEDSDTESDVESIKVNEIDRIETPTSVESISMIDDKSNDSFSLIKENDSSSSSKSPNLLGDKSDSILEMSQEGEFLNAPLGKNVAVCEKNKRCLSPTQILFENEEEGEKMKEIENKTSCSPTQVIPDVEKEVGSKNEEVLRRSNCSPTQILSDSDTSCEEAVDVKKEPQCEETQVLPLSPPANYQPRVLTEEDAWMLGSSEPKVPDSNLERDNQNSNKDNDSDDEWGPLSLELPSTQVFANTVELRVNKKSPEKPPSCSKRSRDSFDDTIKPKSKLLKNENSTFKSPRNLFDNCSNDIKNVQNEVKQVEMTTEGRPQRTRTLSWKVKLNLADEECSPVIKLPNRNKRKPCIVDDESQEKTDSPVIKLPKRGGRAKVLDESEDEENPEPEKPVRRRSARLQKSGSNSSCTSNSSTESAKPIKPIKSTAKTRRASTNNKKKSYFEDNNVKVIFSSYINEHESRIIEILGGIQVWNVTDANIVVTDKVRRTVKFLSALSLGLPIVSPVWISKCNEEKTFVDPWPWLLKDQEQETKFGFDLKTSIEKAKKKKLLQGYKIFATEKAKPPPDELYVIVELCGGIPIRNVPDIWPDKTIVISCPEDEKHWPNPKFRYVKIVHFEFLLIGLLKQKLDFKTYKLR